MPAFRSDSCDPPPIDDKSADDISFYHPVATYANGRPFRILKQPPLDDGGVHANFALDAFNVLTNGVDGFLSESPDRDSTQPRYYSSTAPETVLRGRAYFYHAKDPSLADYAICLDLDSWSARHHPSAWAQAVPSSPKAFSFKAMWRLIKRTKEEDECCAMSGIDYPLQGAHLVPRSCSSQFANDSGNILSLSPNFHTMLDQSTVTIVPRAGVFSAYFLTTQYAECRQVHNTALRFKRAVHLKCLYTRFALGVFERAKHVQADDAEESRNLGDNRPHCARFLLKTRSIPMLGSNRTLHTQAAQAADTRAPWARRFLQLLRRLR